MHAQLDRYVIIAIMEIEFLTAGDLTASQEAALEQLSTAVYPPGAAMTFPGQSFIWASPQWSILVWDRDALVSHVGMLVRDIFQDSAPKRIGGIGAVATHPASQGRGFASAAMRAATERFDTDFGVSYALLFCRSDLIPFYSRLGWQPFTGTVFVEQPDGKMEFTANDAMVLDVKEQAPLDGFLDLNGFPW